MAEINWNNVEFKDEKRFLSNMYPCEVRADLEISQRYPMFDLNNLVYPSSENLYQSLKSLDVETRIAFTGYTPAGSKSKARKIIIREDWDDVKLRAMELCLELKFRDPELRAMLLATGDEHLEERNDWKDVFWGTYLGFGQNHLGRLLMKLRNRLILERWTPDVSL